MKGKQSWSKAPLSIFKNKLSYEEYEKNVRQLVPNFNQEALEDDIANMYMRYIKNYSQIEQTLASRINLTAIGFFSSTQSNIKYWLDRGWTTEQGLQKIKKRQSTCTPEIAKKIQATLLKKSDAEKAEINKKKGNGLNVDWLVKTKGISREEAEHKIFKQCSNAGKTKNELYRSLGKAVSNRQLNFYTERGLSLEEAKIALKERQSTSSLQAFVKKYGYDEGLRRYKKRIDLFKKKWKDTSEEDRIKIICKRLKRNKFFSTESYAVFQALKKDYFIELNCLYGDDEYFLYDDVNKKIFFYDFVILERNMIVEYHGSFWHANAQKDSKDWKNPLYSYEESLQKDSKKKILAEEQGFSYYVIWDYQRNDKKTIERILNINKNKDSNTK